MNSRQVILAVLNKFEAQPGNLERLTERAMAECGLDRRDRSFVFENVYGIVRNRTRLDFLIRKFLDDARLLKNLELMQLMRLGVYQIVYLDRVPDHAAVNETVNLTKESSAVARFSGVVNAILRKCIKLSGKLPAPDASLPLVRRLSILYSHPEWLVQKWLNQFGLSSVKKLLAFNNTPPDNYLRRRLRGVSKPAFENDVKALAEPAGGYLGLYYKLTKRIEISMIGVLKSGLAVIQAPSSGWVTALLDVQPADHCIDLCSAPGGKASLIAELAAKGGSVCAAELKFGRLEMVVETMRRMDLDNLYPLVCDAALVPFVGTFDKVLLDAPCTGTGVMHRHPDGRWIRTAESIAAMVQVQEKLLDAAASMTTAGGVLVYSTCSLEPEENELQIARFLEHHAEFSLEKPAHAVPQSYISLDGFLKITPHEHGMDGMFAARLKRRMA